MVWRVRTEFTGVAGSPWLSTMIFGSASPSQDAVDAVGAFWATIDAHMSTSVSWATLPDVEEIGVDGALISVESTTPASGSGGDAGQMLPPATQGLIRWRTGSIIAGRELRGRTFIPGLCETASDGEPQGTFVTDAQSAASALIADANSEFTILSITHGQARLVATGTLWNRFASLRSRRD